MTRILISANDVPQCNVMFLDKFRLYSEKVSGKFVELYRAAIKQIPHTHRTYYINM